MDSSEFGNQNIEILIYVRAGATGFEPAISALTGPHVSRYTTPPNKTKFTTSKFERQEIIM
jgi:hypothetical protein